MKVFTGRRGRPREFDIDVATRDAMEVFWEKGFHATSLPDLIKKMRLTRGSIYKAYDDKRAIYVAALDIYVEEKLAAFEQDFARKDKRSAIRDVLRRAARNSARNDGQKGCFVTAATVEMLPDDAEVAGRVAALYHGLEGLFTDAIDTGKRDGSITSKASSAALAKFFVATVEGMCVLGKLGPTERNNMGYINLALGLLDEV